MIDVQSTVVQNILDSSSYSDLYSYHSR